MTHLASKAYTEILSSLYLYQHTFFKHSDFSTMSKTDSVYEQEYGNDSTAEINVPRRSHRSGKSGKHLREEPTTLAQLQACPLAMDCFCYQSCFQYCELISQTQHHHELARLFVLHLHDGHVNLIGVDFIMSPETIAQATRIPNVGEKWNKRQQLEKSYYEPYIKPGFIRQLRRVFPFRFLKDEFAPLMKLIVQYFSCEGRFSCLYTYHVHLLMHFTRV